MALGFTVATRNNRLDEITALIDAGTAGFLRIYDGTRPTNADTAVGGQTLLAELTMSATSFPAASSGSMTANAITDDSSANATGTASWFRIVDSAGNAVVDGDVGTSGSDLNLNTTAIASGVTVSVTSLVLTDGNA
jgi:hypothetical protein